VPIVAEQGRSHTGGFALADEDADTRLMHNSLGPRHRLPTVMDTAPNQHSVSGCSGRDVAERGVSWYSKRMEQTPFELTPEQKDLLIALAEETGKPIPVLLAEALAGLQDQMQARNGDPTTPPTDHEAPPCYKHLWEIAADLLHNVPDDDFARHCQVVEAETRSRRVATPLRSYLLSRQPAPYP